MADKVDGIDLDKLDAKTLAPELQPFYNSMLADYRKKTESLANERKDYTNRLASLETEKKSAVETNAAWENWWNQMLATAQQDSTGGGNLGVRDNDAEPLVKEFNKIYEFGNKLADRLEKMEKAFQEGQKTSQILGGLSEQAYDLKLKHRDDPNFDITKVINAAKEYGIANLDLARQIVYGEQDMERKAQVMFDKWKEDWEKTHPPVPSPQASILSGQGNITTPFKGTETPLTRDQAKASAAQKIMEKYGGI